MVQRFHAARHGLMLCLATLTIGTTACSNRPSTNYDVPTPPPMDEEVPAPRPASAAALSAMPARGRTMPTPPPPAAAPASTLPDFLESWRKAWAGRDVAAYLQHYHPAFQGSASTPEQWRAARQQAIGRAGSIELQLGQPEIRQEGADRAWLSFTQRYRAQNLSDEGIKQLQLRRVAGRWLIEQETFTPNRRK